MCSFFTLILGAVAGASVAMLLFWLTREPESQAEALVCMDGYSLIQPGTSTTVDTVYLLGHPSNIVQNPHNPRHLDYVYCYRRFLRRKQVVITVDVGPTGDFPWLVVSKSQQGLD